MKSGRVKNMHYRIQFFLGGDGTGELEKSRFDLVFLNVGIPRQYQELRKYENDTKNM